MSHFTVLVIGKNPEEQLAPFDENLEVDRYIESTKEQLIAKGRKEIEDYKNTTYAAFLEDKEHYIANCKNESHIKYLEEEFPKKLNWTDEEVYEDQTKYDEKENIGPDGEVYSTRNPQSYWDWYQLGGRWTGFFKLKENGEGNVGNVGKAGLMTKPAENGMVDQALKSDIDFVGMRKEAYDKGLAKYDKVASCFESGIIPKLDKTWKEILADDTVKSIEKKREMYHSQDGVLKLKEAKETLEKRGLKDLLDIINSWYFFLDEFQETREQYAQACSDNCIKTFAVVKDGKWYARDKMGWWACVSNEKEDDSWQKEFNSLIDGLPEDTLLSVYDCHI